MLYSTGPRSAYNGEECTPDISNVPRFNRRWSSSGTPGSRPFYGSLQTPIPGKDFVGTDLKEPAECEFCGQN